MFKTYSQDNPWFTRNSQRGVKDSKTPPPAFLRSLCKFSLKAIKRPGLPYARRRRLCFRFAYIALALALILTMASTAFADGGNSTTPGDTGPLIKALRSLAKVVVDTLIAVAAILMVVGVATGFVAGQLMTTLGAPYGASTAMIRVVSVILLAIGAFLTTIIANTVIDAVAGMVPATEIKVPVPGGGQSGFLKDLLPAAYIWTKTLLV